MAISVPSPLNARDLELYGAGYGVLSFEGKPVELVANFRDSGQPALGSPQDVMTINDYYPKAIVPPQAIASGTIAFDTYGLRTYGIWGTILNGHFEGAKNLVDVFRQQLEKGSINVFWTTVSASGVPTKIIQYEGLVVTNCQPNRTVTNTGATVATQTFTCKYTFAMERIL